MGDTVSEFRLFAFPVAADPYSVDHHAAIPKFSNVEFGKNLDQSCCVSRGSLMKCTNPNVLYSNLNNLNSPYVVKVLSCNDDSILLDEQVLNTLDSWAQLKNPGKFIDKCEEEDESIHRWYDELGEDVLRFLSDTGRGVVDLHDIGKIFGGTSKEIVIVPACISTFRNEDRRFTAKLTQSLQPKDESDFNKLARADVDCFKRLLIDLLVLPLFEYGDDSFHKWKSIFSKWMGWDRDKRITVLLNDLESPWLDFVPPSAILHHPSLNSPSDSTHYVHKLNLQIFFKKFDTSLPTLNCLFQNNWKTILRQFAQNGVFSDVHNCLLHGLKKKYLSVVHSVALKKDTFENYVIDDETNRKTLFQDLYKLFFNAEKHLVRRSRNNHLHNMEEVFCYVDTAIGGAMIPSIHSLLIEHWGKIIKDGLMTMHLIGAAVTAHVNRKRKEMILRMNCFHYLRCTRTLFWSEVYSV